MDAGLLCLLEIGFLKAEDPRFLGTLAQVERHLIHGGFLHRYAKPDDFGPPEVAFNVCTFWYIDALAAVRSEEHTSELKSLMRISYAVFCWIKKSLYQNLPSHELL